YLFKFFWIVWSIGFIFSFSNLYPQEKSRISVYFESEKRTDSILAYRIGDVIYVSPEELANLINVKTVYNPQNKKLVLRVGSCEIKITALNPFILVDESVHQIPLSTIDVGGNIYVPLALFLEVVGPMLPAELNFQPDDDILRIRNLQYNITGIEIEEIANGSLIRFVTTKNFQVSDVATSKNRGWFYVTIYGAKLDTTYIASEKPIGIVQRIVPFQFEDSAQITFFLGQDVSDPKIYVNQGEIIISLRSTQEFNAALINSSQEERSRWLIDRIIIDPGHGGRDPGAVGRSGLTEKEVNLDIAKRLKSLLEDKLEIDVLLTREDDETFIELWERTQFANSQQGKLFISIHCNSNKNRAVHGSSIYVLGPAKTQEALEVAEKENSVIQMYESTDALQEYDDTIHILNAINQSSNLEESLELARMTNESLKKKTKLQQFGDGIYQAGFRVLVGAAMPRICVETAFISNEYEERLLRTKNFHQQAAEAIYESIKQFKEKYEQGIR
ncbi:N-acetylmuramoyl-L-alanine amidase, partial [bacterium]|nr:N-acetylmuramoyl-L-alanine amidase [bacterium]